jgi:phage/plasmid-like protein (TIGR03299 family)
MILNNRVETAYEALDASKLNYVVESSELMNIATGVVSKQTKQLYRSDTKEVIADIGIGYEVVQNIEAFSFFDVVCNANNLQYNEIKEFKNGAKIVLTAINPEPIEIRPNDEIIREFCFTNGHDGTLGLSCFFKVNRLVCTNGLRMNVQDSKISFRHTKNIKLKLEDALKIYAKGENYFNDFVEISKRMCQKQVDSIMVDNFLNSLYEDKNSTKTENKKEEIKRLFENGKGNGKGTVYDLLNGLTEYVDHFGFEKNREEQSLIGRGMALKEKAFNLAKALV